MQQKGAEIPEVTGNYSPELKKAVEACLAKEPWDRLRLILYGNMQRLTSVEKNAIGNFSLPRKADREKNPSGPKKPEREEKKHSDPDKTLPVGKEKSGNPEGGIYRFGRCSDSHRNRSILFYWFRV